MTLEVMALVLHHSKATGTDKLVLLGIANHDGDGGAWPKVETLAKYANRSRSTVQESIGRLVASGELVRHLQEGGTHKTAPRFRPNRYEILVVCPPNCDRTKHHRISDLPQAPADLWKTGAQPTGPHSAGAQPTGRHGARPTGPEPSLEPITHQGSASVTGPREDLPFCDVCSLPGAECLRRPRSGHDYKPVKRDPRRALAIVREEYAP